MTKFQARSATALLAVMCLFGSQAALAQAPKYPERPIRLIVGYGAGSTTDLLARAFVPALAAELGQPIIIDNKPGAAGAVAMQQLKTARPDGYSLGFAAFAALVIVPHLADTQYDIQNDISLVAGVASTDLLCVVNQSIPARNFAEIIEYSKAHPDTLLWATPGGGTMSSFLLETLKRDYGLRALHVPYKSTSEYLPDLSEGRVNIACDPLSIQRALVDSGKVRPIAVTGRVRQPGMPNLPTLAEANPALVFDGYFGIVAPAKLPKHILERLESALKKTLKDPSVIAAIEKGGMQVASLRATDFTKMQRADLERYGKLVQAAGLAGKK